MANFIKVTPQQDSEGHWYILPSEMVDRFNEDLENEDMSESGEFGEKWDGHRTGGCLSNIQLYATKEDLNNL